MHNYSSPQCQYFVKASFCRITATSILRYVSRSLAHLATGNFAHSSRQNCSSSFKLDGFHWCTAIFKSYPRFSVGLRSGIWLDHSKIFKMFPLKPLEWCLAVCLGSMSCWKLNLCPSLKSLEDWNRFPSRFSQYFAPSFNQFWPVWCCHHHASLSYFLTLHFWERAHK